MPFTEATAFAELSPILQSHPPSPGPPTYRPNTPPVAAGASPEKFLLITLLRGPRRETPLIPLPGAQLTRQLQILVTLSYFVVTSSRPLRGEHKVRQVAPVNRPRVTAMHLSLLLHPRRAALNVPLPGPITLRSQTILAFPGLPFYTEVADALAPEGVRRA